MTIEIGDFVNNVCNSAYSSVGLNRMFSSILNSSAVLAILIIILIMLIYPCKKGTASWILVKIFLYIFGTAFIFMYIHDSAIRQTYEEKHRDKSTDNLIDGIARGGNIFHDEKKTVLPALSAKSHRDITEDDLHTPVEELDTDEILTSLGV